MNFIICPLDTNLNVACLTNEHCRQHEFHLSRRWVHCRHSDIPQLSVCAWTHPVGAAGVPGKEVSKGEWRRTQKRWRRQTVRRLTSVLTRHSPVHADTTFITSLHQPLRNLLEISETFTVVQTRILCRNRVENERICLVDECYYAWYYFQVNSLFV